MFAYAAAMSSDRIGQIAVIFTNRRTIADPAGYAAAASAMDALAAQQPGYRGIESVRGEDGFGITISYWADEASAIAWREQADHAAVRASGRTRWYESYDLQVATIGRSYRWRRA